MESYKQILDLIYQAVSDSITFNKSRSYIYVDYSNNRYMLICDVGLKDIVDNPKVNSVLPDLQNFLESFFSSNASKQKTKFSVYFKHNEPIYISHPIDLTIHKIKKDHIIFIDENEFITPFARKAIDRIIKIISDAGDPGIEKKYLTLKTNHLTKDERNNILLDLISSGEIIEEKISTDTNSKTVYKINRES